MSGISKIVMGRLRAWAAGNTDYGHQAATDTLELITAYEQSQKELEEQEKRIIGQFLYLKNLETHFDTANSRIAELEKLLKRVEPSTATTIELYRDITEALYVVKEQTDERR